MCVRKDNEFETGSALSLLPPLSNEEPSMYTHALYGDPDNVSETIVLINIRY